MPGTRSTEAELEVRYEQVTADLLRHGARAARCLAMARWGICRQTFCAYLSEVYERLKAANAGSVENRRAVYVERIEALLDGAERGETVKLLSLLAKIEGVLAPLKIEGTLAPVDREASLAALREAGSGQTPTPE